MQELVVSGVLPHTGPRPHPDMSLDFSLWKHQVRHAIGGLCTFPFQGSCHPDRAPDAGFREAMHILYRQACFTEFLACQAWRQAGVSEATGQALEALARALAAYDEPDSDAAIVADPVYWAIVGQAIRIVNLLG